MTIHCFDVIYSPNSSMDYYLSSWLNSWSAWSEETLDEPQLKNIGGKHPENAVESSGFMENRFQWDDIGREPLADAEYVVSGLIGETGYLASYCDWWIVRWHECDHDEENGSDCSWQVIDSSNNYSSQADVPKQVTN